MNDEQGKAHFLMKALNPTPRQKEKTLALISAQLDRHNEIRFACCHGSFMEDGPFRDIDIAIFLEPDFLSEINFRYEMHSKSVKLPVMSYELYNLPNRF